MKKRSLSFILILSLVLSLCGGCGRSELGNGTLFLHSDASASDAFDALTASLFRSKMAQDPLSCHYTLADPTACGIAFDEIGFSPLSLETAKKEKKETAQFLDDLHDIAYRNLDDRRKLLYDLLVSYYEGQADLADFYYYQNLLSPTDGIPGNLPILLSSYAFNDAQDIETYLQLLDDVDIYLNQVNVYGEEQAEEGLLPAASTLADTAKFCRSFSEFSQDHLLLASFRERLAQCNFLEKTQQQKYEARNAALVKDVVLPSYKILGEKLETLAASSENSGCLCHLPRGQNYYALLVKNYCGFDISPFLLFQQIEEERSRCLEEMSALFLRDPSLAHKIAACSCPLSEPQEMMEVLQRSIAGDYPAFPKTDLTISQISPQLRAYSAPAFYFISPVDRIQRQQIFYDPESFSSNLSLFTTMAHEGFPGHLYQTVLSYSYGYEPVRSLLSFPGYTEGWATYVETESYGYAGLPEDLAAVLAKNQSVVLSLYASADIGIHYYGWEKEDLKDFLKTYGIEKDGAIAEIYRLILNSPGNYLKYAVGHMKFRELRQKIKAAYPDVFTLMDFHKSILQTGPAPFPVVEKELLDHFEALEKKR